VHLARSVALGFLPAALDAVYLALRALTYVAGVRATETPVT
jgi:hypothetical protein